MTADPGAERSASPLSPTRTAPPAFTRTATLLTASAGALALLLSVLVSPGLSRRVTHYEVGQFAVAAIRAPYDFSVVDEDATARRRTEAARHTPVVLTLDRSVPAAIASSVSRAFAPVASLLAEAETRRAPPEEDLKTLSAAQQSALRRRVAAASDRRLARDLSEVLPKLQSALGLKFAPETLSALRRERFGEAVVRLLNRLALDVYTQPVVADRSELEDRVRAGLDAGELPRRVAVRQSDSGADGGLLDLSMVRTVDDVRALLPTRSDVLAPEQPSDLRGEVVQILQAQLRPNATYDSTATMERQTTAALSALPVSLTFRRNQLIVGEGQEVTGQTVLALRYLEARRLPSVWLWRLAGSALTCFLLLLAAAQVVHGSPAGRTAVRDLACAASGIAFTATVFWLWLSVADRMVVGSPGTPTVVLSLLFPLAAASMLTRFVAGFAVALLQVIVTAVAVGLMAEPGAALAAYTTVIGLVGVRAVATCNSRACLMRTGLSVAVAAACASVGLSLLMGLDLWAAATTVTASAAGGVVSGLLVVALAPAAENLFGYTTRISMLEMVSYEHPLLKRLMLQAPGTFQHSVSIGVLADAAAVAVGADALLVRVGALYHDVGKTTNSGLFVENQSSGNPHDSLSAAESASLIRAHVADGVAILREYGLPARIADFVREHHGTRLLTHLFDCAREHDSGCEAGDFQYPGPRPRSRETAILMIADQVEATSRTMPGAGADGYREMVDRTIDRLRVEHQLDDAPLTLRDIARLRDALVAVLVGMHHHRIEYPSPRPVAARS